MRIVVQRVTRSSVTIKGELISEIGKGLMALIGVQEGDTVSILDFEFEYVK